MDSRATAPSTGVRTLFRKVASAFTGPTADDQVAMESAAWKLGDVKRMLPRTLMGGTAAMREAGTTFLPQHPAESRGSYELRLNNTVLYNGFQETVTKQSAKFFGEPVQMLDTVPEPVQVLAGNIDGQGRALTPFCIDLVKEAFVDGISFILVDAPQVPQGATYADQKSIGAQPYWVLVSAGQLIGWRTENQFGKQVLVQARIRERMTVPTGTFSESTEDRIRVLEPGKWQVWAKRQLGDVKRWLLINEGLSSLDYVPLVPFYTNRTAYFEGEPPLRTLAEMNLEHWMSSSEQRRALSFLRFAMLVVHGVDSNSDAFTIGADKVLTLPAGADAHYVEHSGAGIKAGADDLDDIEKRMQASGMELRVEAAGRVTATAAALDSEETSAGLRAVAKGLEDAIEQALQMTADLLGLPEGGDVDIHDDFGSHEVMGTPADLLMARNSNNLSQPTFWSELQRRGVLSDDFDAEAEQARLDGEQQKSMDLQQKYFAQQPQPNQQPLTDGNPNDGGNTP